MSARREARARFPILVSGEGGVPACLVIGPCIEVWAIEELRPPWSSARARHNRVRAWWGEQAGLNATQLRETLPFRQAWSVESADFLGKAGFALSDLPRLREQAEHLMDIAVPPRTKAGADRDHRTDARGLRVGDGRQDS